MLRLEQRELFWYGVQGRSQWDKLVPNLDKKKKKLLPSPARQKIRPTDAVIQEVIEGIQNDRATDVAPEGYRIHENVNKLI
jgi:hypothetical protein